MTYDEAVRRHYDHVGDEYGLSPQSTMADDITRQIETNAILTFVSSAAPNGRVADFGCGNGYTLSRLAEYFPRLRLTGYEPNQHIEESLRKADASRGVQLFLTVIYANQRSTNPRNLICSSANVSLSIS